MCVVFRTQSRCYTQSHYKRLCVVFRTQSQCYTQSPYKRLCVVFRTQETQSQCYTQSHYKRLCVVFRTQETQSQCYRQAVVLVVSEMTSGDCERPVRGLQSIRAGVNDVLACPLRRYIRSVDHPSIQWYKNCEPLQEDEKFVPNEDLLNIRKVHLDDAGLYTCKLTFSLGGVVGEMAESVECEVNGSGTLPLRPEGPSCACSVRQHIGGLLHKPSGGSAIVSLLQAGSPDPPVGPGEATLIEGYIPGYLRQGPRPGEWRLVPRSTCSLPRRRRNVDCGSFSAIQPLWAEVRSARFSSDCSAHRSFGKGSPGRGQSSAGSPVLADPSMVLGPSSPLEMGSNPSLLGEWVDPSPPPRTVETVGLASEGD
ncbi:hypothetical protein PO909_032876 [Leuciscus waleckii]